MLKVRKQERGQSPLHLVLRPAFKFRPVESKKKMYKKLALFSEGINNE